MAAREMKQDPPLPLFLLVPFLLARSLTLVSRSLLLNRTETLAKQAKFLRVRKFLACVAGGIVVPWPTFLAAVARVAVGATKNGRARGRHARGFPSCAHYFQAPATQAMAAEPPPREASGEASRDLLPIFSRLHR